MTNRIILLKYIYQNNIKIKFLNQREQEHEVRYYMHVYLCKPTGNVKLYYQILIQTEFHSALIYSKI